MSDFDRIREEGERISREEGYKVLLAEIAARPPDQNPCWIITTTALSAAESAIKNNE